MSNRHIESLTIRLLQALDNNYDVVNMDAVLSVIAALENTKITKEQLEATRLAKYINLFRRRTKSEQLAKRAKSLLKKWREMVGIQQPAAGPSTMGSSNDLQYVGPTSPPIAGGGGGAFGNTFNTGDKQTKSNTRTEDSSEPTSFINLIPNFSSSNIPANSNTMGFVTNGPSVRSGRKNRGLKHQNETMFNSEQLVNTSTLNMSSIATPTIVIDIDDSNSGSNVIEKQDDVVIIGETTKLSSNIKPNKPKKAKKDKKRPRDVRESSSTTLVVIDAESSESQQQQTDRIMPTSITMPEKPDDKSRNSNLATTNMSEILSLSNSSMSCVFPSSSVGDIKNTYSLKKGRPLTESDLSFAGKFGGTGISPTNKNIAIENTATNANSTGPSSSHAGDIYVYNENSNAGCPTGVGSTLKSSTKSRIFGGSGYNSNDSVSNSRHSNFDIVDSVSQGVPNETINTVGVVLSEVIPPVPVEKVPKKRGRKKGSKGVDSLIAKDTSLSSQMLMQSLSGGSKKVKTTKELYAEMQNRKLGVSTPTTPSHWTGGGNSQQQIQQQRRRDSFCSEPSLHSPRTFDACSTNATISTIATSSTTPDKSVTASRKFLDAGVVDVDSSSDSLMSGVMSHESIIRESTSTNTLTAVEQQLRELVQTLPPVPSICDLEHTCALDIVPCSCQIIEKMPENVSEKETESPSNTLKGEVPNFDSLKNLNLPSSVELTTNVMKIENENVTISKPIEPVKPKKSIFDLDFDEDEDPLHTLIAEVAAAKTNNLATDEISKIENNTQNNEMEITIENQNMDETLQFSTGDIAGGQIGATLPFALDSNATDVFQVPQFPTYTIEEDPFCLAKQRFELQTQQITEFHINLLHNFFIPNVNGNWNDAVDSTTTLQATEHKSFQVVDGSNVVPKITVEDHIRKDLREFNFQRNFTPKSTTNDSVMYEVPFLGVARCLTKTHRKTRKNRQKRSKNSTINAELPNEVNLTKNEENHSHETIDDTIALVTATEPQEDDNENTKIEKPLEVPKAWNLPVNHQKAALKAISINVDNNDDDKSNLNPADVCNVDSQNLLAIASNIVGDFSSADKMIGNELPLKSDNTELETKSIVEPDTELQPKTELEAQPQTELEQQSESQPEPEFHPSNYPNISGDIFNNNNNNLSLKYEEELSSCESNSSLKQTQNSINQKLREHRRQQRRQQFEIEQNSPKSSTKRKRRRKKQKTPPPPIKIKCIKIAINGGITTQRHIQMASSTNSNSSDDYTENDEEESEVTVRRKVRKYDDDHHEQSDSEEATQEEENWEDYEEEKKSYKKLKAQHENDGDEEEEEDDDALNEENEYEGACGDEEYADEDEGDGDGEEYDGDGDEYFGEFHEVVTRDLSPLTALGNNHIVLTIKKTPSKTNSPVSNSPNVTNQIATTTIQTVAAAAAVAAATIMPNTNETDKMENEARVQENNIAQLNNTSAEIKAQMNDDNEALIKRKLSQKNLMAAAYASLIRDISMRRRLKRRRRKLIKQQPPPFRFPDEVAKTSANAASRTVKKRHQQLFFPYEIYTQTDSGGTKRRIFDMSSCSSSCEESSEYEDESDTSENDEKEQTIKHQTNQNQIKTEAKTNTNRMSSSDSSDLSDVSEIDDADDNEHNILLTPVKVKEICSTNPKEDIKNETSSVIENELSKENNGLLVSFNDICVATSTTTTPSDEIKLLPSTSSSEFNQNNELNNKLSLLKWKPKQEFCTGTRVIHSNNKMADNDVTTMKAAATANSNSQVQQFKEWHQLLQLKSYNDELLTVLPYVVLD